MALAVRVKQAKTAPAPAPVVRTPVPRPATGRIPRGGAAKTPAKTTKAPAAAAVAAKPWVGEEGLTKAVVLLREAFASPDPARHIDGARMLGGVPDDYVGQLQTKWRQIARADMYTDLFERSGRGVTPGIAHALILLRQSFARSANLRAEFAAVYTDAKIIHSYAWQAKTYFTGFDHGDTRSRAEGQKGPSLRETHDWTANVNEAYGLAALRDHTAAVRTLIDADFTAYHGLGIADWLVANAPRTDASLRAIAIMRDGNDRALSVDLAVTIIPPSHTNATHALNLLESVPFEQRQKIEAAFDRIFAGVTPNPMQAGPIGLRQHLAKLDPAVLDPRAFQHILILLRHEPTMAETLYLHLSGWWHAEFDSAIGVLQACVDRGIGRDRLEADWNLYVRAPIHPGIAPFAKHSLLDQINRVFLTPTRAKARILALLTALDARDDVVEPVVTDTTPLERQATERARDERHDASEKRRLLAASETIAAASGRSDADDQVVVEAIGVIVRVHAERVARLRRLASATRQDPTREAAEREMLANRYERQAKVAAAEALQTKRDLHARVLNVYDLPGTAPSVKLSVEQRIAARLMIVNGPNAADKMWVALLENDDDTLVSVVTRAWAERGIDSLREAAGQAVLDPSGATIRPAFDPVGAISAESHLWNGVRWLTEKTPKLPARRVLALLKGGTGDAARGAARIAVEMAEGTAASDLQPIVDLFAQPGLKPDLRDQVITAYIALKHPDRARAQAVWNNEAEFFLARMAETHEGVRTRPYVRLAQLIIPPDTAVAQAKHIAAVRAADNQGKFGGIAKSAARLVSTIDGDFLEEAVERSVDRADFFARATAEQLQPMMDEAGVTTREALAAHEATIFTSRHGALNALENTCASLIAGFVETLVEAGLSPLTGGAGLAAVLGAAVASMASMVASEAMLGPDFKLFCWENFNKVLSDSLGSALVEADPRQLVVKHAPLKFLGKREKLRQTLQNSAGGVIETAITSAVDTGMSYLTRDKWPSSIDVARAADMVLGTIAAKTVGTQGTVEYHPGKYRAYMPFADRLTIGVLFKLSLKTTAIAKEVVSILVANARDQTVADAVVQVMWKGARSVATAVTKAAGSTVGGAAAAYAERAHIDKLRRTRPDIFPELVMAVAQDSYNKHLELQAEHLDHPKGGTPMTPVQFVFWKIGHADPPGETKIAKLQSEMHKAMAAHAEELLDSRPARGVGAYREKAATMAETVAEVKGRPRGPLAVDAPHHKAPAEPTAAGKLLQRAKDRVGLGHPAEAVPMLPPGMTSERQFFAALRVAAEKPDAASGQPAPLATQGIRLDLKTARAWRTELATRFLKDGLGESRLRLKVLTTEVDRLARAAGEELE